MVLLSCLFPKNLGLALYLLSTLQRSAWPVVFHTMEQIFFSHSHHFAFRSEWSTLALAADSGAIDDVGIQIERKVMRSETWQQLLDWQRQ
jgi:hypothetical protein